MHIAVAADETKYTPHDTHLVLELNLRVVLVALIPRNLVNRVKFLQRLGNDPHGLSHVLLGDDQWRRKSDTAISSPISSPSRSNSHVHMRRLG